MAREARTAAPPSPGGLSHRDGPGKGPRSAARAPEADRTAGKPRRGTQDRRPATAIPQIAKTQLIVNELASGVRVEINPEANTNMLRLYEFVVTELSKPRVEGIANARKVLRTLREGFEGIRAEANELERTGKVPALDQLKMVHTTA